MAVERSIRASIVAAARQMLDEGLVAGTAGNVSARRPNSSTFWITPSGVSFTALTRAQLVAIDLDGKRVRGRLEPSSDTMNHAAIYRRRPDVGAVVHTHSPHATVFAVLHRPIPALLAEAAGYLGGEVPVMAYLPPANPHLGERAADGLGSHRAVLLANHGVIAVGETLDTAVTTARLVEHSARIAFMAMTIGEPKPLPSDEVERLHAFLHTEYGQRARKRVD